ncbi:MAG: ferritin [Candidatus Omnitrophica bacterium]|nr:ferritin [Candidatus Omnitrophota bacterium]
MLSKKMKQAINEQITREIYSAYLYLSMEAYSIASGLKGFANWFRVQVQEELSHAGKMYDYINQQGGRVILETIDAPPSEFKSPKDLFKKTLDHERKVTAWINGIADQARKENDNATGIFMQWFVTEQVEEEANASEMLQKLELVGDNMGGLFMLDAELAKRVFTPPAPAA